MIVVPEEFAISTVTREGAAGRAWIAGLPAVVDALCERWNLVVDGRPMHGYLGLVVPVTYGDESCVLKVSWLDDAIVDEAAALTAWNGNGAVRLLRSDIPAGAMLLERLDWTHTLETVEIAEALRIAGKLLRRLAIPLKDGIRSMSAMAQEIARDVPERWERYGRPMPQHVIQQVEELALDLGTSADRLLVNYDLHFGDVLASRREPWLAVDPKAVIGAPEFGVAQLLWQRLEDIEANGGLDRLFPVLVDAAELDFALTRDWTLVRCVDYWLWGLTVGLTYDPARCERIVNWLLSLPTHA